MNTGYRNAWFMALVLFATGAAAKNLYLSSGRRGKVNVPAARDFVHEAFEEGEVSVISSEALHGDCSDLIILVGKE